MQKTLKHVVLGGASVVSLGLAMETPALAQGAPVAALEEVVVTARRREEQIQQVPVAVTAVSGEQLTVRSVAGVSELSSFTPNLRMSAETRGAGMSAINLRGSFAVNLTIANDPAVGIYFDETPTGRSAGALLSTLQDMQSVQVLRGNQGTLFGRNNTGGAILLTPNRPDLHDIHARATATYGNYDLKEGSVMLSAPIVAGKLGVRGVYQNTQRDGVGRSFANGRSFGDRDREMGRVSLRYQPVDALTFDLTYDFTKVNESGLPITRVVPAVVLPAGGGYYDTNTDLAPLAYFKAQGWTLRTAWEVNDDTTLKVIAGYRDMDFQNNLDVDGTNIATVNAVQAGRQHQFTGEINLSGKILQDSFSDGGSVDYVVGAFYFNEQGRDNSSTNGVVTDLTSGRTQYSTGNNSSIAAYGQVEAHFSDRTSAWVGARYTSDRRKLIVSGTNNRVCSLVGPPPGCRLSGDREFNYGSWSVGVRHAFNDDINVYARIANGQKAGGLDDTPTNIEAFEPEVLTDYEAGLKADWLEGTLRTNIAVFRGKMKGLQRSQLLVDASNVPYTSISNVGKATVSGFEFEGSWRIVSPLTIGGSLGYVKSKYGAFIAAGGRNLTGLVFNGTPKWSYSAYLDYTVPVGDRGQVAARLDYGYKSAVYFRDALDPILKQDGVGLVNARLTWRPGKVGAVEPEIALWGKNLTNQQYSVAGLANGATSVLWRNDEPKTYGVTLAVKY